jgi:hypothetical protein
LDEKVGERVQKKIEIFGLSVYLGDSMIDLTLETSVALAVFHGLHLQFGGQNDWWSILRKFASVRPRSRPG